MTGGSNYLTAVASRMMPVRFVQAKPVSPLTPSGRGMFLPTDARDVRRTLLRSLEPLPPSPTVDCVPVAFTKHSAALSLNRH